MSGTKSGWTTAMMREVGTLHATLEANGDLEGTMKTLIDVPVYEFWPMGKRMIGADAVLKYYQHLIDDFMPRQIGYTMIEETLSESAISQEYIIELRGPDGPELHRVLGVLFAAKDSPGLLGGERIWGSEEFLRQMIGPVWDELETI